MTFPITFIVPGRPIGYYASGARPNWTRRNEYHKYKAWTQTCARRAGVVLPLIADKHRMLVISTAAFFPKRIHSDPGNIQKGIVDALFYDSPSGDKYTGGYFAPPIYDAERPRVEVCIRQAVGADFFLSTNHLGKGALV